MIPDRYRVVDRSERDGVRQWLLRDVELDRPCVARFPPDSPATRERIAQLARLDHPAIPVVHAASGGSPPWVVASVVPDRALSSDDPIRLRIDALAAVARGLAHAHARGVSHGAIDLDAVRVGEHGAVLLTGWWRARGTPRGDLDSLVALARSLGDPDLVSALDPGPADLPELIRVLEAWHSDAARRERALELLHRASTLDGDRRALATEVRELRHRALQRRQVHRTATSPWEDLAPTYALEDRADELEARAVRIEVGIEHLVQQAAGLAPNASEVLSKRFELVRERHRTAQRTDDRDAERRALVTARELVDRLPDAHPSAASIRSWAAGIGRLTLHTDPPGAEVRLYRYAERHRRLRPEPVDSPGKTPLVAVEIPEGSYLIELVSPGRIPVRYPVWIARGEHWDGVPPGGDRPQPIYLPHDGELGPDEVYVPPGRAWLGGPIAYAMPRSFTWVHGFAIDRHPVTAGEYVRFLNDLVAAGQLDRVAAAAPSNEAESSGFLRRLDDGRFTLGKLESRHPIYEIPPLAAWSYARWRAERTGRPHRVVSEFEWEKAARGVDGRWYPWGNRLHGTFANQFSAWPSYPHPSPVDAFPDDVSPYGVRGMVGNVFDVAIEPYRPILEPVERAPVPDPTAPAPPPGTPVVRRGSSYSERYDPYVITAMRGYVRDAALTGFRLARTLDPEVP